MSARLFWALYAFGLMAVVGAGAALAMS